MKRSIDARFSASAVVALALIAALPTWSTIFYSWIYTAQHSHGLLISVISIVWLFSRVKAIPQRPVRHVSWLAFCALICALCAWLVSFRAGLNSFQELLAPAILVLSICLALGANTARRLAAPLLYLYFATSIWDALVPILQRITIVVTEGSLRLLGVAAQIRDTVVTIPEGQFEIEDACSGGQYFVAALALTVIIAHVLQLKRTHRVLLVAISALNAMVGNWIRVITIIYAGHVTDMRSYLVSHEHVTFGYALFAVLMAAIYALARTFTPGDTATQRIPTSKDVFEPNAGMRRVLVTALPLLTTTSAWIANYHHEFRGDPQTLELPPTIREFSLGSPALADWMPSSRGAQANVRASYCNVDCVDLYVARYNVKTTSLHLPSGVADLGGVTYETVNSSALVSGLKSMKIDDVQLLAMRAENAAPRLIAYNYQIAKHDFTNRVAAQLYFGLTSWFDPSPVLVVATAIQCTSNCLSKLAASLSVRSELNLSAPLSIDD